MQRTFQVGRLVEQFHISTAKNTALSQCILEVFSTNLPLPRNSHRKTRRWPLNRPLHSQRLNLFSPSFLPVRQIFRRGTNLLGCNKSWMSRLACCKERETLWKVLLLLYWSTCGQAHSWQNSIFWRPYKYEKACPNCLTLLCSFKWRINRNTT